jgi:aminopeptidase domain protein
MVDIGNEMYALCAKLFPICRSITGNGVRETLHILKKIVPEMTIHEVPSGTKVFDWGVPKEWNIYDAWIKNGKGEKILDFQESNLHVMGYSLPVDKQVSLDELLPLIYTQPDQPDAIPYVTSYYKERYGFCMTQKQKDALGDDNYHIYIDSELKDGSLTYGEIMIPSTEGKHDEIFLSTYVCHPSMANNELSGPAVTIYLAKHLLARKRRRYNYRIIFIPETIGAITYLSKHLPEMKKNIRAGFNISCVGDDRTYSYIASRYGETLADKAAKNALSFHYPNYKSYSFLQRGSDERQYNAPGVDLPVCAVCRSKYGEYPEYHTSKDDMGLISPGGLQGAYEVYDDIINTLEHNRIYQVQCFCEPQLGKRGLYPTVSQKGSSNEIKNMVNFIAYADGTNDLIDISNRVRVPVKDLILIVEKLLGNHLIRAVEG